MLTLSCPGQDIQVGDIVIFGTNLINSPRLHLKYRVTGFLKLNNMTLVNGLRVTWDRRQSTFVSWGKEQTLHSCFKMTNSDFWLLIGQHLPKAEYESIAPKWRTS